MDGSENTVSIPDDDASGLGLLTSSRPQLDDETLSLELQSLALEQHQTVVEESGEDKKEEDKKEEQEKEEEEDKKEDQEDKEEDGESDSDGEVKAGNDDEEPCENHEDELEARDDKSPGFQYPVRPDAVDCSFYLRTGTCKFGSNCKFNHPIRRNNQVFVCV